MAAAAVKFILFIRIYKWPDIVEEDMDGGLKAGYGDPVAAQDCFVPGNIDQLHYEWALFATQAKRLEGVKVEHIGPSGISEHISRCLTTI